MWFGGQHQPNNNNAPPTRAANNNNSTDNFSAEMNSSNNNTISSSSMEQQQVSQDKISFHMKSSIFTRRVTLDKNKMALGLIKQLAIAFLNELYFQNPPPAGTYMGDYIRKHYSNNDNLNHLYERLQLSLVNSDQNTFVPFNLVSDIEPESYVIIEVSERADNLLMSHHHLATCSSGSSSGGSSPSSTQQLQCRIVHDFKPETFLRPTYCASCSCIIKGIIRQGSQCQQCRKNYCPKCKGQVEGLGEPCFISPQQQPDPTPPFADQSTAKPEVAQQQLASNGSAAGKRKSPSNLLHFNIANPFKSHHNASPTLIQPPPTSKESGKTRGSAGALDPVLQQLSRLRDQTAHAGQQQQPMSKLDESGQPVSSQQQAHLSSSHQDLFNSSQLSSAKNNNAESGSSSAHQSPIGSVGAKTETGPPRTAGQLSSSARTSAADLLPLSSPNKASDHSFLSMDWIQVDEKLQCEACRKPLRSSSGLGPAGAGPSRAQQPASMCKVCKIQVHAHCQTLVLVDCMNRLVEASRAAASTADEPIQDQQQTEEDRTVKSTNSNLSRENIRLCRLVPSVRQVKRPDASKPIIEGWLRHTTLSDEFARRHYWRLDETDITLYENDTSKRYFKAIALNKITRVMSAGSLPKRVREDVLISSLKLAAQESATSEAPISELSGNGSEENRTTSPIKSAELQAQMRAMFAFELATGSMYLVQADSELEASRWRDSLAGRLEALGQQLKQPTESDPAAKQPSAGAKAAGAASERQLATVNKLVESISRMGADLMSGQQPGAEQQSQLEPAQVAPGKTDEPSPRPQRNVMVAQERQPPLQRPTQQQHQQQQRHQHHYAGSGAGSRRGQPDPHRSRLYNRPRISIKLDPMAIPDHLVEGKYLIERDRHKGHGFEELGSGQFGKVYAAIAEWKAEDSVRGIWSGVPVAIKEISKSRFDLRQQAKLKNEANILSRLDHPGVIILERVHDLPDKIYIVMEQLEDDMLEMIVSTEEKRLSERITKFLTYQILEALKYLHAQNIAHCDLKPENVLLVERRSQFPQIKLCDFGFAKIIEENSFRSSLVGTPAYLAPEVVKGERYNRSVDLWSVGVIVYVSLSGEFPFNEGENIHDQISRANFMYPDQPWAKISQQAKDFINSLLKVNCEKRLSANRAQMDDWIQDYQLWCDLSELEVRVGKRWVTDDADYERWSRYAKEKQLVIPQAAEQLHEELMAE